MKLQKTALLGWLLAQLRKTATESETIATQESDKEVKDESPGRRDDGIPTDRAGAHISVGEWKAAAGVPATPAGVQSGLVVLAIMLTVAVMIVVAQPITTPTIILVSVLIGAIILIVHKIHRMKH